MSSTSSIPTLTRIISLVTPATRLFLLRKRALMGPFYFYPAHVLEETFRNRSPAMSTKEALQLEDVLHPHRSVEAYEKHRTGELVVAHTVVCIRSMLA